MAHLFMVRLFVLRMCEECSLAQRRELFMSTPQRPKTYLLVARQGIQSREEIALDFSVLVSLPR